jgi:hypothetical protein
MLETRKTNFLITTLTEAFQEQTSETYACPSITTKKAQLVKTGLISR